MRIGQVAERAGVTVKTLRYYEAIGLIEAPEREVGGYRAYGDDIFDRLTFIKAAQALDLSLGEVMEILSYREEGVAPCAHVLALIERRAADIDARIHELTKIREDLRALAERGRALDPAACATTTVCHVIVPDGHRPLADERTGAGGRRAR